MAINKNRNRRDSFSSGPNPGRRNSPRKSDDSNESYRGYDEDEDFDETGVSYGRENDEEIDVDEDDYDEREEEYEDYDEDVDDRNQYESGSRNVTNRRTRSFDEGTGDNDMYYGKGSRTRSTGRAGSQIPTSYSSTGNRNVNQGGRRNQRQENKGSNEWNSESRAWSGNNQNTNNTSSGRRFGNSSWSNARKNQGDLSGNQNESYSSNSGRRGYGSRRLDR